MNINLEKRKARVELGELLKESCVPEKEDSYKKFEIRIDPKTENRYLVITLLPKPNGVDPTGEIGPIEFWSKIGLSDAIYFHYSRDKEVFLRGGF